MTMMFSGCRVAFVVVMVAMATGEALGDETSGRGAKGSTSGKLDIDALVKQMFGPPRDPGPLLAKLREGRKTASPKEQVLIDRMIVTVKRVSEHPDDLKGAFTSTLAIMRELGKLHPDDFQTQITIASSLLMAAESAKNLEMDDTAIRNEAIAATKKLVQRFPTEGRAYGQLGWVTVMTGGDDLTALRLYAKCLELDKSPKAKFCADNYEGLASEYRAPRCANADVRQDLALYAASETRTNGKQRAVTWAGKSLYLDEKAGVSGQDIAEIRPSKEDSASRLPEYNLTLTAAGQSKLAKLTTPAKNDAEQWLAFLLGNDVLMAARVSSPLTGPNVRLTARVQMAQLCKRVEQRELPKDLKTNP